MSTKATTMYCNCKNVVLCKDKVATKNHNRSLYKPSAKFTFCFTLAFPCEFCVMGNSAVDASLALLSIEDLYVSFVRRQQNLEAVRGVSLQLKAGEILALVGESGSGKTLTALSLLQLLPSSAHITEGKIIFAGEDVGTYSQERLRQFRGGEASMIFQEPMSALNPVLKVGYQIQEVLQSHLGLRGKVAKERCKELLLNVGISNPEKRMHNYPFQLSGGMLQRVMIAMALATSPRLLIADEPTTSLDVTIQAQILSLIKELSLQKKMAVLFITHNLASVAQLADNVAIMYAGKIVEYGDTRSIFTEGKHPYTQALLRSLPGIKNNSSTQTKDQIKSKTSTKNKSKKEESSRPRLTPIAGQLPSLWEIPAGCAFAPRCDFQETVCKEDIPQQKKNQHRWLCIR